MPHLVRGRTLWMVLMVLLLGPPARAEQADVYVVTGVKVQASAPRPEMARAKAVSDGESVALARLLRKLTLPEDHANLPKPDAEALRGIVRNFSVESENQQGDKYTASIAYSFDRETVRAMLEGANIPFLDTPSPPLVVLPVWREEGKPALWDDPNPWREAWMRLEPADTLVDFARPRGDLADLKAISGEEAAAGNRAALGRIGDTYKAGLIAVALGTVEKGQRRIAVQLYDLANGRTSAVGVFPAGTDEAGLDKAAAAIARAIDTTWKKGAVAIEQNAAVVRVRAPLQGLEHWIKIRQSLSSMPQLRALTTISMSPGEALIELRFAGTLAELRRELDQRGMSVTVEPAAAGAPETWLLKPPSTAVKESDLPTPPERAKDGAAPEKKSEPPKKP